MNAKGNVSRRTLAVIVLLVVVFGSVVLYYNLALAGETARASELQKVASELQTRNSDLENRLSTLGQVNASVLGLNPVGIYDNSNRTVVTIQGSKLVVVNTFFGPQQTIESVIGSGFVIDYSNSYYVVTNFHEVDGGPIRP